MSSLRSASPAGLVPDIAGPRVYELDALLRAYLRARRTRRPIVKVPLPDAAARAVRAGAVLAPDRAVGRRTWEEFLAEHLPASTTAAGSRGSQTLSS